MGQQRTGYGDGAGGSARSGAPAPGPPPTHAGEHRSGSALPHRWPESEGRESGRIETLRGRPVGPFDVPPEPAGTPRCVTVGDGRLPHLRPGARTTKPGSPGWGGAAPPAGGLGLRPRRGRGRAGRDSAPPPWAGGGVGYPGRIVTEAGSSPPFFPWDPRGKGAEPWRRRVSSPAEKKQSNPPQPNSVSQPEDSETLVRVSPEAYRALGPVLGVAGSGRFTVLKPRPQCLAAVLAQPRPWCKGDLPYCEQLPHQCIVPRDHLLKRVSHTIS